MQRVTGRSYFNARSIAFAGDAALIPSRDQIVPFCLAMAPTSINAPSQRQRYREILDRAMPSPTIRRTSPHGRTRFVVIRAVAFRLERNYRHEGFIDIRSRMMGVELLRDKHPTTV